MHLLHLDSLVDSRRNHPLVGIQLLIQPEGSLLLLVVEECNLRWRHQLEGSHLQLVEVESTHIRSVGVAPMHQVRSTLRPCLQQAFASPPGTFGPLHPFPFLDECTCHWAARHSHRSPSQYLRGAA